MTGANESGNLSRYKLIGNEKIEATISEFTQPIMSQDCCKLQQTCQFYPVAKSLLKSGSLQHVICRLLTNKSTLITSSDNQLATSLLTTCNRLFVNKLSQAMRTPPGINLLMTVYRKMLESVRFWLCNRHHYNVLIVLGDCLQQQITLT